MNKVMLQTPRAMTTSTAQIGFATYRQGCGKPAPAPTTGLGHGFEESLRMSKDFRYAHAVFDLFLSQGELSQSPKSGHQ
jgi:hypothetical protein